MPAGYADESEQPDNVDRLIIQLNAERFGIRRQASLELLAAGEKALPKLLHAADSISPEQRDRVRALSRQIRLVALKKSFARIIRRDDAAIDLDEGMILIARILDPAVDQQAIEEQLDELAAAVRARLGAAIDVKRAAPQDLVDALIGVLRDDFKLSGNVVDYDNPNNSSLQRVFATRRGLPILISHVAVSIAERLDMLIVGLAIPRRYMIKYDGSRAPAGQPQDDIIIDPFGNWRVLTSEEIKQTIPSFDAKKHLTASPRRESLARMLRNLISDLARTGEREKAADVQQILLLLENSR